METTSFDVKERDTKDIISYLVHSLNSILSTWERPARTKNGKNATYLVQEEMMYIIDEITRGPICTMQKAIADGNALLEEVRNISAERAA